MTNLNSRRLDLSRTIERVQTPLEQFIACTFSLYDQDNGGDYEASKNYDWRDSTGWQGERFKLLDKVEAQVQVYRFTLTVDAPIGAVDMYRTVRFTAAASDIGDTVIRRAQVIEVDSCPLNSSLENYQYIVSSGLNAGAPFRRTIECEVDMARVINR